MPTRAKQKEQPAGLPTLRAVDPDCPEEALTACLKETSTTEDRARALKLWVVFNRAFNAVRKHLEASVNSHGLTDGEFGVLEVLFHKGPLLLGEVQKKILASSGGVTYLVDRLEKKGLVRRDPCPSDRRALYAVLTPEGEAVIKDIFPRHAKAIERALSGLTAKDQEALTELLREMGMRAADLPIESRRK
jgi:MarR family transcriptional regulator, 2-MHQ and catechol-resistance regulon repressor